MCSRVRGVNHLKRSRTHFQKVVTKSNIYGKMSKSPEESQTEKLKKLRKKVKKSKKISFCYHAIISSNLKNVLYL